MQKNWRKKILTGIGILAGAFVLSTAVDPTSVSAEPDAMEEIIGHGEWKQDGDQWYYYQDGEMLKNCWVKDGKMLHDCWAEADGSHYYFRGWGGAFHDQTVTIDGKEYVFDSSCNGVLKEEEPEEIKVTEITVSGQTEMYVGDTQKLEAAVLPENASDKKVTWTSDNEEIITTTEDGSGVKGTIQIAVEETIVEAESLTITGIEGDTLHLTEAGQTVQLGAEILPENTTDKTITWETDQPEVITIDETGLVTAKTNGTAKITAKTTNGIKAELTVTVEITSEETTPPEETSPEVIPPETTPPETTLTEE